jgi:hypothetical protein
MHKLTVTAEELALIQGALMNTRDQDENGGSPEQIAEMTAIDVLLAKIAAQAAAPQGWDRETIRTVLSEMIGSLDDGYSPGRTGFDG